MSALAQQQSSSSSVPEVVLNDGNRIPQLGMGVWEVDPDITARVVNDGIEAGYRLIDTAEGYHNEEGVGEAVRNASVPRDQLFIVSKLRNGAHARDEALKAFDTTMEALGLEQLDMFMIHWPVPGQDKYVEAWKALIELREQGRIRSIGVCNFNPDHIERLVQETGVKPVINQIELHPHFPQFDKREPMKQQGIAIESYSPLGHGDTLKDPAIAEIGKKYGRGPAQVILRWHLQQGLIAIPRSVHAERLKENFDVFDFSLGASDMEKLAKLDKGEEGRTGSNPATNNDLF